ncbi:10053_t:CDS:2, partial [Gigaspora rosea]
QTYESHLDKFSNFYKYIQTKYNYTGKISVPYLLELTCTENVINYESTNDSINSKTLLCIIEELISKGKLGSSILVSIKVYLELILQTMFFNGINFSRAILAAGLVEAANKNAEQNLYKIYKQIQSQNKHILEIFFDCSWSYVWEAIQASDEFIFIVILQ